MNILITNDDGWGSKGILSLVGEMRKMGHVTVLAPDGARSGQSNAISVGKMVTLKQIEPDIYITNGTPSDCVKLALSTIYADRKPDLVVSGINHGSNASINVIYSGTMGACFVAAEAGIPSIGFSLCDHRADADFSFFTPHIVPLTEKFLKQGFPDGVCYNINAPVGEIKGVLFTRQCRGHWHKEWQPYTDPNGGTFYLLTGEYVNHEPKAQDTDEWALSHGFIAVTPTTIDMTHYGSL